MENGRDGGVKSENYFSGFASLVFFLRGWGGVFNIRRRTSSGFRLGSSSLRDSSGFIGKSSEIIFSCLSDNDYKLKAEMLLATTNNVFYANLGDYEYGMPYADETILKTILRKLGKLDLITHQNLEKVLQFLPQNPEYHEE